MRELSERSGAAIVSDGAHLFGARRNGRPVAQLADATATSFHPVKGVTTGEGGAVFTAREDWALRAERFRNHGIERDPTRQRKTGGSGYYEVQDLGLNFRLPDLLCALGLSQLRRLDEFFAGAERLQPSTRALLPGSKASNCRRPKSGWNPVGTSM